MNRSGRQIGWIEIGIAAIELDIIELQRMLAVAYSRK